MARRKNNPENAPEPASTALAVAEAPDPLNIPADYCYVRNLRHGQIRNSLSKIVDRMFKRALENPNSDANLMVRILLLNQVALMRPELYNDDAKLCLGEERYRRKTERDVELDENNVRELKAQAEHRQKLLDQAERKITLAEKRFELDKKQLQDAATLARSAQISLDHNEPMDPRTVYTKIAEIVGLRAPESFQPEG